MPKIHRLSPHEAQKIAAGEVVERPANVVKELIENAIDAGATTITVYVKEGGKELIRIVDNGCGMSQEDALLCFEHHATSKLSSVDQLPTIGTFGFRGEALSSIASVSTITLITKESDGDEAVLLELEYGNIINRSIIAANQGTDIAVRNLFANVPARKKFLKSTDTEWRAIQQIFHAFCFDYTTITFKLFSHDKLMIHCPATNDLGTRITQLWDAGAAHCMIPIQACNKDETIRVNGYVSNHQHMRYDRSNIFFFVNKRWVKQIKLSSALLKGYLNVLPAGRYPAACIFIETDPTQVDINIHPRKEEVQFLHPKIVEQLVHHAAKESLENNVSQQLKKTVSFTPATQLSHTPYSAASGLNFDPMYTIKMPSVSSRVGQSLALLNDTNAVSVEESTPASIWPEQIDLGVNQDQTKNYVQKTNVQTSNSFNLIGYFKKTYILLEQEDGLFIVDQHAAHERVLYELFSTRFESIATIPLLFPQTITATANDVALIVPYLDIFLNNGIDIAMIHDTQLIVRSMPVHLKNQSIEDIIHTTIGCIIENPVADQQQLVKLLHEKLHAQMACKAAVKAGDALSPQEMQQLVQDLYKTANRFTCPHGRPTGWLLDIHDIEKKFKRKV